MHKHCPNVCKLRPCLDKESKNLARMHTIMIAAMQRQYSQMEIPFWTTYIVSSIFMVKKSWAMKDFKLTLSSLSL
jgi:hypothetical protein